MMSGPVRQGDDGRSEVVLGGRLTIETASEVAGTIRQALEGGGPVSLSFDEVSEVDLTIIQILCAACRMASARSQEFMLSGTVPPLINRLVDEAGGTRLTPCRHHAETMCIWFGGER